MLFLACYVARGRRTAEDANRILLNEEIGGAEIDPYVIRSNVPVYVLGRDSIRRESQIG